MPRLFFLIASLFALAVPLQARPQEMNVIMIIVDDLRPQLGCYGDTFAQTPHIDRLAAQGLIFDNAHCQYALCSPSRTSFLSGVRPDHTGIEAKDKQQRKQQLSQLINLPAWFKQHGWYSAGFGKIHHGHSDKNDYSEPYVAKVTKHYVLPENVDHEARLMKEGQAKGLKDKALRAHYKGPPTEAAEVPDNAYPTGQVGDLAVEAIARLKDRPFFLALGPTKPHLPFNAPQKYWDLYDPETLPLASNPNAPEGAPSYALSNYTELRSYKDVPDQGSIPDKLARQLIHGYYAAVSFTDTQVGRVLDALEAADIADRTIVVLFGDHGWKLGQHGGWCKHSNYEIDTRVPLIIYDPTRVQSHGQRTEALVELVDIYPTLCELTGIDLPGNLQGLSAAPLLNNPHKSWKEAAFSQYPRNGRNGYSLRTARHRYVEWLSADGQRVFVELYDHQHDPEENRNIADHPENKALLEHLSSLLDQGNGWEAVQQRVAP